jgi:hypothetical protein
MNLLISLRSIF